MAVTATSSLPKISERTWTALGLVYVIWGSTYLGIRVVVRSMPALGAMGLRFVANLSDRL